MSDDDLRKALFCGLDAASLHEVACRWPDLTLLVRMASGKRFAVRAASCEHAMNIEIAGGDAVRDVSQCATQAGWSQP